MTPSKRSRRLSPLKPNRLIEATTAQELCEKREGAKSGVVAFRHLLLLAVLIHSRRE